MWINAAHKQVDKKLTHRKELRQALNKHSSLANVPWKDRREDYGENYKSQINPLKDYYLKSDCDSDEEVELQLQHSQTQVDILQKISLIPNAFVSESGELSYDINAQSTTYPCNTHKGSIQSNLKKKRPNKKLKAFKRPENNYYPNDNLKASYGDLNLPQIPIGQLCLNQHMNDYFVRGDVNKNGRQSEFWKNFNNKIKQLEEADQQTHINPGDILRQRHDMIQEELKNKEIEFYKQKALEMLNFYNDAEIKDRITKKEQEKLNTILTARTLSKKTLKSSQLREDLLMGGSKMVPDHKIDTYSPRRALQFNPYKSYWMDCVDKLLAVDNCYQIPEPGYYKLVCARMQTRRFNPREFVELDNEAIDIIEKVFYCNNKVEYDIYTSKIEAEMIVQTRIRPDLAITVEQALSELGYLERPGVSKKVSKIKGSFISQNLQVGGSYKEVLIPRLSTREFATIRPFKGVLEESELSLRLGSGEHSELFKNFQTEEPSKENSDNLTERIMQENVDEEGYCQICAEFVMPKDILDTKCLTFVKDEISTNLNPNNHMMSKQSIQSVQSLSRNS